MKQVIRDPAVLQRMEMAFELSELAETMQRQNIRRRHPELSPGEVEERVDAWLARSPQSELGADKVFFRVRETSD